MRVALNAQLLSWSESFRSGGINRCISHLLRELARDPRGHSYTAFVPRLPPRDDELAAGAVHFRATGEATERPTARIVWEQTVLPQLLSAERPDLLHSTAYASPVVWRGPSVVTVYDLSFLRYPKAFNRGNQVYLAAMTRLSARRARRVLTISHASKADIVQLLGIPREKIDVTHPAAEAYYRPLPKETVDAFRAAKDLPEVFLFAVGTLEPRKNVDGLLEAYALLPTPRPPLYVAGGTGWGFAPIFGRLRELQLERDVHFLGFVPEEELPLWYNAAYLFAYPSLYEGFGLPVLEAMACGTPVITSNVASIPEVAGKAAILLPPRDTQRLAAEISALLDQPQRRPAMRAAGLIQASRFSWRSLADQTVQSYERASRGR